MGIWENIVNKTAAILLGIGTIGTLLLTGKKASASLPGRSGSVLDVPGFRDRLQKEPSFGPRYLAIIDELGFNDSHADYLAAVISFESKFRPDIKNPGSSASGLIQFMEATAKQYGTTTAALRAMTGTEQLEYVKRFFMPYKGGSINARDLAMAVFSPVYIGKPDSHIMYSSGSSAYSANSGLDKEGKGYITVGDYKRLTDSIHAAGQAKPRIPIGTVTFSGGSGPPSRSTASLATGVIGWMVISTLALRAP